MKNLRCKIFNDWFVKWLIIGIHLILFAFFLGCFEKKEKEKSKKETEAYYRGLMFECYFFPVPDLFPSNATNGHCAQIDSSSRSVMMIGGNDVMYGSATSLMPFLNTFVLDNTTENIQYIIDWNLENGKEILLEGRKKAGEYLTALFNYNRKRTGKDLLTQYNEFETKVKAQMSGFDSNDLKLQRKFLTMGIYTAFKSK